MSRWQEPDPPATEHVREHYRLWRIVALILVVLGGVYLFMRWNPFSWGGSKPAHATGGTVPFRSQTVSKLRDQYPETREPASTNHSAEPVKASTTPNDKMSEELLTTLKGLQAGQAAQTLAISKLHERLEQQKGYGQTTQAPKETEAQRRQREQEAKREAEEHERKLKEWKPKVWERTEDKEKRSEVQEAVDGEPDPLRLNAGWAIPIAIEGQMTSMAKGRTRFWVTRDVKDSATGQNILLAQDSYGMLESQGSVLVGDERLTVITAKDMSWPDGTPITLGDTSVADVTGMPGFGDLLDRRVLPNLLAALMTGVLRLGTAMPIASSGGIGERAGAAVGMEMANRGSEQVRQAVNTSPRMRIRNAYQGVVWLKKPMVFSRAYVRP